MSKAKRAFCGVPLGHTVGPVPGGFFVQPEPTALFDQFHPSLIWGIFKIIKGSIIVFMADRAVFSPRAAYQGNNRHVFPQVP